MLRHVVAERAGAECDFFSGCVGDRKGDAAAEAIVEAAACFAGEKARRIEEFIGIFLLEMTIERITGGGREADAESCDGFAVEAAILEVAAGGAAFGCVI